MKRSLMCVVAAGFALTWAGVLAQGQAKQAEQAAKKELLYVSSGQAKFKDMMPGVSQAVVWGDPDKGAYGSFTKFVPGYDAGMHTHTNDVSIVVIKGAYLYKDASGEIAFVRRVFSTHSSGRSRPRARNA